MIFIAGYYYHFSLDTIGHCYEVLSWGANIDENGWAADWETPCRNGIIAVVISTQLVSPIQYPPA